MRPSAHTLSVRRRVIVAWTVIGGVLFVFDLPGINVRSDLATWADWLGWVDGRVGAWLPIAVWLAGIGVMYFLWRGKPNDDRGTASSRIGAHFTVMEAHSPQHKSALRQGLANEVMDLRGIKTELLDSSGFKLQGEALARRLADLNAMVDGIAHNIRHKYADWIDMYPQGHLLNESDSVYVGRFIDARIAGLRAIREQII
jgi:hypothetical protein